MIINSILIIIWLVQPMCSTNDELYDIQLIQTAWDTEIFTINGHKTTLRAFYGNIQPTDQINPGSKILSMIRSKQKIVINSDMLVIDELCACGAYVERQYSIDSSSNLLLELATLGTDSPKSIAKLIEQCMNDQTSSLRPIMLVGDSRSGKSIALVKIQQDLQKSKPQSLSIRIPLKEMYSPTTFVEDITLENIIERIVGRDFGELLNNLLKVNPKRIIFLFDGIDHLTELQRRKIVDIIKFVAEKQAIVLISGREHTQVFLKKYIQMHIFKINQLNYVETKQFFMYAWSRELKKISGDRRLGGRLQEYVFMFVYKLFKTQLPRQPLTLMILAEIFNRQSSTLLSGTHKNYLVGCLDYVLEQSMNVKDLFIAMEQVSVDKNLLFEKFVSSINGGNANHLDWHYGAAAMLELLYTSMESTAADNLMKNFGITRETLRQIILQQQVESAIFFDLSDPYTIKFIHEEFRNYFAAKFITTWTVHSTVQVEIWQTFLSTPDHSRGLLEFLNWLVKDLAPTSLPIFSSLKTSAPIRYDIMNNIIAHEFEHLFRYTYNSFSAAIYPKLVRQYFLYTYQQFSKPKIIFGMMYSKMPHPEPNPYESLKSSPISCTPVTLLVENNMLQACHTLLLSGVWFPIELSMYHAYYHDLLRVAVTRPIPNIKFVDFLIRHTIQVPTERLNDLLYHAIDKVGIRSQSLCKYLVNRSPAAIPTNTQSNGRTLLHAAVKWNSVTLVQFVLIELKVPPLDTIDNFGETVFAALLNANPSPYWTDDGWWECTAYVVQNVKRLSVPYAAFTPNALKIPREDILSPWFKLLIYGEAHFDGANELVDASTITIRPAKGHNDIIREIYELNRFRIMNSWPLSSNTLALRRTLQPSFRHNILPDFALTRNNPLEMLLLYRGVRSLSAKLHQHYRSAIVFLLQHEGPYMTATEIVRVLNILGNNIGDPEDLEYFKYFTNYFREMRWTVTHDTVMKVNLERILAARLKVSLDSRLSVISIITNPSVNNIPLDIRILGQAANYRPIMSRDVIKNIMQILRLLQLEKFERMITTKRSDLCLSRRSRRNNVISHNCLFSWKDIDEFNDAVDRRVIRQIRVNSDSFVSLLAGLEVTDRQKALQLLQLVRELHVNSGDTIITGKSRLILQDIIRHDGLYNYRRNQRITDVISDIGGKVNGNFKRLPMPSRTVALFAASSIPLIRGIHATIVMCVQQRNDTNNNACYLASGALAMSAYLTTMSFVGIKFIPWIISRLTTTAIDFIPISASPIIRENIRLLRYLGVKFGIQTASVGIGIIGIGFDLYNIVEMSKIIDMCSRENSCLSKDKIDYIVSLTFSCVSLVVMGGMMISGIGFVPGLLIGLGLLIVEEFAKGINNVVYYNDNYHTNLDENFRIFWHNVGLQPPPIDVQALVQRTEIIKNLERRVKEFLETIDDDTVVAYGVGIISHNSMKPSGNSSINMATADLKNTDGLSRVLPIATANTSLLCLPRRNVNEIYDKYSQSVPDAIYKCDNSFVIAHKQRWMMRTAKSYIIYDLENIAMGQIIGSDTVNNLFFINNSTELLNIVGGRGNITNAFMIRSAAFHGNIQLRESKNILDLSTVNSRVLKFTWNARFQIGRVQFDDDRNETCDIYTVNNIAPNLQIIGRLEKSDIITCNYSQQKDSENHLFTVDSRGGESLLNMDTVIDCEISMVQPWTDIIGTNSSETTYKAYVWLKYPKLDSEKFAYTTIKPYESKFIVTFLNRPLFASCYDVKFQPQSNNLTWNIQDTSSTSLLLSIIPYRSPHSTDLQSNVSSMAPEISTVNCIFIDSYFGAIVYPVINYTNETDNIMHIRYFNVFVPINSTKLSDVVAVYLNMETYYSQEFNIITKLTHNTSGQSFIFGSTMDDRFYIDVNTTFIFGGNGSDVFVLNKDSPKFVLINNEASDNALDTLIIPDTVCNYLYAQLSNNNDLSSYDVVLYCSHDINWFNNNINVKLHNYFLDRNHRHLQIYWHDATYILLPYEWTRPYADDDDNGSQAFVELALFFSFDGEWQSTTLTLTNNDSWVVLNASIAENPLVAYATGSSDLILSRKYLNHVSSSFVVLQDFLVNITSDSIINQWPLLRIFIVNDTINDTTLLQALDARDIFNLYLDTLMDFNYKNIDLIKEYSVDLTNMTADNTISIKHNDAVDGKQLGVLIMIGAEPKEFQINSMYNDSSLSLCAHKTCIIIREWCESIEHRIHRIEFIVSPARRPLVIRNIDEFECVSSKIDHQLIQQLYHQFNITQMKLLLTDIENDDNDNGRLIRCISIVFADNIAYEHMYKVFGFTSITDQITFIRDNCNVIFQREKFVNLTQSSVQSVFQNTVEIFKLNDAMENDMRIDVEFVIESFKKLSDQCWNDFKSSLYNYNNNSLELFHERKHILSHCVNRNEEFSDLLYRR